MQDSDQVPSEGTVFSAEKMIEGTSADLPSSGDAMPFGMPLPPGHNQANFTPAFRSYLEHYIHALEVKQQPVAEPLEADELASRVARVYEQVRRVIDWKEEHIVRRNAIERSLKRALFGELSNLGLQSKVQAVDIAGPMVMELIRNGYFDSGTIAASQVSYVQLVLEKYLTILHYQDAQLGSFAVKDKLNLFSDIVELAACEIEEVLDPAYREHALLNLMTQVLMDRTKSRPDGLLTQDEIFTRMYIAVQRSLFSLDSSIIFYNLLKLQYPHWFRTDAEGLAVLAEQFTTIKENIEELLADQHVSHYYRLATRYAAAYRIIGDIMAKIAEQVKDSPKSLPFKLDEDSEILAMVSETYQNRYDTLKRRLARSAAFSTASILLSGIVSFFIFEGPIAGLVGQHFSWFALGVDLLVPTILMFLFVVMIQPPGEKNFKRVESEVKKVIFTRFAGDSYVVNLQKKKNIFVQSIFTTISLIAGGGTLLLIWRIFDLAGVPWTSLYIDTMVVSMIIFAALIIRDRSKEISVEESGSVSEFILDLFTLPLAKLGQWLSAKYREWNIVGVFFTVLVDAPFSTVLKTIEEWRAYLKDARSEIY